MKHTSACAGSLLRREARLEKVGGSITMLCVGNVKAIVLRRRRSPKRSPKKGQLLDHTHRLLAVPKSSNETLGVPKSTKKGDGRRRGAGIATNETEWATLLQAAAVVESAVRALYSPIG